jgi:hypothetical protein
MPHTPWMIRAKPNVRQDCTFTDHLFPPSTLSAIP